MADSGQSAGTGPGPDASAVYSLGSSRQESARLQLQADDLTALSGALIGRAGLRPGQRAIDLGCGPRGVLDLLAESVAPGGRVVGVDADPLHATMAAEFAAGRNLDEVEVLTADARRTGLPGDFFDLVHTRTLLVTIPRPEEVVSEMARLARPGGWVMSLEYDMEYALCYPPIPAFERICEIFSVAFRRNGADPWIGRRVPELFRAAGLTGVLTEIQAPVYPPGHPRLTIRADMVRSMRTHVLQMGLASAAELDELDAAVRAHLHAPATIAMSGLAFLVSGRKPA